MGEDNQKIMNRISHLLFTEKHVMTLNDAEGMLSDESLAQAVTVNEMLSAYGFMLRPEDIIKLAHYDADVMRSVIDRTADYTDIVKADPMYHDFPTEVMEMDEAQFRFDQVCHYFSTYGIESLFEVEVSHGWLPEEGKANDKTRDDDPLLSFKVLTLENQEFAYRDAVMSILSKKERMTPPEKELVTDIIAVTRPEILDGVKFGFKENMEDIFASILLSDELGDATVKGPILRKLCQHSGDAIRGIEATLSVSKCHLTTSQKRTAVRLIEDFPATDLAENLWLSKKKSEQAKRVLSAISYNSYSRNKESRAVVDAARNNELTSFEGRVKKLLETDPAGAAKLAAKRPGWFLRMLTLFLRNKVFPETLQQLLCANAEALSATSLVGVLNAFGDRCVNAETTEPSDVFRIVRCALAYHFMKVSTPLEGKKVYIDDRDIDLEQSRLDANAKSADGGFLGSGLAYRIPDDASTIRGFVYWNDAERVDLDLHCHAYDRNGQSIHVGWNGDYISHEGIVFSGDITHSDAAEYIDVLTDGSVAAASIAVHLYAGQPSFKEVDTCFAGIMAVDSLAEDVKLYNPKNCYMSHELLQQARTIDYGYIDLVHHVVVYHGQPTHDIYGSMPDLDHLTPMFSLADYLEIVIAAQCAKRVKSPDEADISLVFNKAQDESEISLADENFFLDY